MDQVDGINLIVYSDIDEPEQQPILYLKNTYV